MTDKPRIRATARPKPLAEQGHRVPPEARGVLTIDLGALTANYRDLAAMAGGATCAGMVKANAYGMGLERVATALADAGCTTFFVAALIEAQQLREILPKAVIYVLDGLMPETSPMFAAKGIRPVLSSLVEVREWAEFCRKKGRRLPAGLHIDTGLGRLGMPEYEVEMLAAEPGLTEAFELGLVMSHLACADEAGHPMTPAQKATFDRLRARLPKAPASLANSAATLTGPDYHYDLVRPGISIYGGRAVEGRPNPMRPVVKLESRILQVRDAKAGETVGYGASFRIERPMKVACVALGYADGFVRSLSAPSGRPGPVAYFGDYAAPLIGRISMDLVTLDVTAVPAGLARRGAWVEFLNARVTVDDRADAAGTIGYEVLTRLGPRCHKVYIGG